MKIGGQLTYNGNNYFVILNQTKNGKSWTIYDRYTPDQKMKLVLGTLPKTTMGVNTQLGLGVTRGHVIEHLLSKNKDSEVYNLPGTNNEIILKIMDSVSSMSRSGVRRENYKKEEILYHNEFATQHIKLSNNFKAKYIRGNKQYMYIEYRDKDIYLKMSPLASLKSITNLPKENELVIANRTITERAYVENVSSITFDMLEGTHDLSWLIDEDTGEWKKDYRMIENIDDFENYVVTPYLQHLEECIQLGIKDDTAMDTETTGLGVYNLPEGSPEKDHLVTMQLTWKENQAVIINFDMEKFGNVPVDYVMKRLHPLFKEYIPRDKNKWNIIKDVSGKEYKFRRSDIRLIGHNTIFDCRVTWSTGYPWFFDEDTMQLRFNLDPVGSKGNKGLKAMSRQFLGEHQLELSDTLGPGNEDKYRYIQDRKVSLAYGCADSDMTWRNFKILLRITPPKMYEAYKKFNMYTWYILAEAEYNGIKLKEEDLKAKTESVGKNLKAIEDFLHYYVGSAVAKKNLEQEVLLEDKAGLLDKPMKEVFAERWAKVDKSPTKLKHKFSLRGEELRTVIYDLLKYPVLLRTETGQSAINKEAIQKLLKYENKGNARLGDHLYTCDYDKTNPKHHNDDGSPKDDYILINKDKFNKYKFPVAYVLSKYKDLDKEYTGYYLPFSKGDWGGRIYKGFSTTNIETQRISNPIQTTKKDLKKMIIATGPDWYPVNWDKAQIEARVFVAEAGDYKMVHKLNNPENDYHTENASLMFSIPAYLVSKDLRKASKTINFGLPYGLGPDKMCERIHDGVINEENKLDTQLKIAAYKRANILTWNLLESYRDSALEEWHCSDEFKEFLGYEGRKLGHVTNASGFHRLFDLTDVTENWQREKIRRAAGNFPIQSYAKDIFTLSIIRLYIRLEELGLRDKFQIHMLVHDEIQCSAHKSIDPIFLMSLFAECCMPSIKCKTPAAAPEYEYTEYDTYMNYFVGINFGDSWYDCKQDANECPVGYVYWMINKLKTGEYKPVEWCDRPRDIIEPTMEEYFKIRLHQVFRNLQNDIDSVPIKFENIASTITNYTARAWTTDTYKPLVKLGKSASADEKFFGSLASWALDFYGEDKLVEYKGNVLSILDLMNNNFLQDIKTESPTILTDSLFEKDDIDFSDLEQSDNYSFDENELVEEYFDMQRAVIEEEIEETNAELLLKSRSKKLKAIRETENLRTLTKVRILGTAAEVYCGNKEEMKEVIKFLEPYKSLTKDYIGVCIKCQGTLKRVLKVNKEVDWVAVDGLISKDNVNPSSISSFGKSTTV